MTRSADLFYMQTALELAGKGVGRTSPNPAVGCVVAKGGRIIGRGYHRKAGGPHAEVFALEEAGAEAAGADVYVTLEPCSHHGRTPPCVDALVAAKPARVVVAVTDPNPEVAGRGVKALEAAGIEVMTGVLEDEARSLNEGFFFSVVNKSAFVHLKMAATLDGRIATAAGDSRWVSSEESRLGSHRLRDRTNAVIIGVETAMVDDPKLNVRLPGLPERTVQRVVIDRTLRISPALFMLSEAEAPHTLIACGEDVKTAHVRRIEALGAKVLKLPGNPDGRLMLRGLLTRLYEMGYMEAMVEGGGQTARAFLDQGLVNRCHFYYTTRILGGSDAVAMIGGESPARMSDAVALEGVEVRSCGPDIYVTGTIAAGGGE